MGRRSIPGKSRRLPQQPVRQLPGLLVVEDQGDGHVVFRQNAVDGLQGDTDGLLPGITIDTGRDERKRQGPAVVPCGQTNSALVAGAEQIRLPMAAPLPTGPTVWMTYLAGRAKPSVMTAAPVSQCPTARQAHSSWAHPAAPKMAPQTPQPGVSSLLAAFTMASALTLVISPFSSLIGMSFLSPLITEKSLDI